MKVKLFLFLNLFFVTALKSQIKVIENGTVHLGAPLNTSNYVTIGDRARYCNSKLSLYAYHTAALCIDHTANINQNYEWSTFVNTDNPLTKSWIVARKSFHNFWVYGNGDCWAKGFNGKFSDSTLKFDITNMTGSLDKIIQLQGVYYRMKPYYLGIADDGTDSSLTQKRRMGFLAQQVAPIVPEVVDTTFIDSLTGFKMGMDYPSLVALLVEGMKEQQSLILGLKSRLDFCCPESEGVNGNNELMPGSTPSGNGSRTARVSSLNKLYQNTPNPFNAATHIDYELNPSSTQAALFVYDMQGKQLHRYALPIVKKGSLTIYANEYTAGMYLYSLQVDGREIDTKRMILTAE